MSRVLFVCLLLGWGTAGAASEEPWAAVLRTSSPEDTELASRLQGQLSDLPVTLEVRPGPAPGLPPREQWRAVMELAEQGPFRVVIWFRHEPEAILVHVAEPGTRRLLVRRVQAQPGRTARSAAAEAAALMVRSALKALVAGTPVGDVVEEAPPPPPVQPPPPPPPPPPSPPAPAPGGWGVSVGWQLLLAGRGPIVQHGAQLAVGREGRRLRTRAVVLATLPAHLTDEYTRVSLSRYALGGGLDAAVVASEHFRLSLGGEAGATAFWRSTRALVPGVEATASRLTPTLYVAPTVSARWRAGVVGVEAGFALDVLAGVPTLGYQQQQTFVVRNSLWRTQPRFALTLLLGAR